MLYDRDVEELSEILSGLACSTTSEQVRTLSLLRCTIAALARLLSESTRCPEPSEVELASGEPLEASSIQATAVGVTCIHRGGILEKGSCSCGDGNVWACAILGKQIGKACGEDRCTKYEAPADPSTQA